MTWRSAVALSVVLTVGVSEAAADRLVIARWRQLLQSNEQALQKGNFAAALKTSERLIREAMDLLGTGEPANRFLSLVVLHKALAHAGLGQTEEALWYWRVATSMQPELAKADLSSFGAAGEVGKFLIAAREPPPAAPPQDEQPDPERKVSAPVIRKRVQPQFPEGARYFGVEGILIVEIVVTKDGRVTMPRILKPLPAPALNYAALEAIKHWQFEPGKLKGEPVDVIYALTVNYEIP